jgi:hypothetical protein
MSKDRRKPPRRGASARGSKKTTQGRHIPEAVRCTLWGQAAGRCEFAGCNEPVSHHRGTKERVNLGEAAHIIGFSKDGPRGESQLSPQLAKDVTNLMLLCPACHKTIDDNEDRYTIPVLREMKRAHESRIQLVTGIDPSRRSHLVLYGTKVGDQASPLTHANAASAMFPDSYPASSEPIALGMLNSSFTDRDRVFWEVESQHLTRMVTEQIRPRLVHHEVKNLSIFGFAPQPLLMLLGYLLSDIAPAETFQLHREPADWKWRSHPGATLFKVTEPPRVSGAVALVLSVSATVNNDRVEKVLGKDAAIWRVDVETPHNDVLESREQLQEFRRTIRRLLDRIKAVHGETVPIHVFPAAPVAVAVELGRVVMPKADLALRIYDQQQALGGFVHALDLGALPVAQGASS